MEKEEVRPLLICEADGDCQEPAEVYVWMWGQRRDHRWRGQPLCLGHAGGRLRLVEALGERAGVEPVPTGTTWATLY